MRNEDCVAFLQWALPRLGMRWPGFRRVRGQVCKRIHRRMVELQLGDVQDYREYLESNPAEWRVLDSFCRITISRFYRDRGVFELIGSRLLPEAAERAAAGTEPAVVRCWSTGCASGEEPYSLSIVWRLHVIDLFPAVRLHVIATDADETMLERARRACYDRSTLRELPDDWVEAAFEPVAGELCLRPPFREGVELLRQDVREEMPDGPFHLVLCRNLIFTYFESDLQGRLLGDIAERLHPGGCLVLGAHEQLPGEDDRFQRLVPGEPVFRRR